MLGGQKTLENIGQVALKLFSFISLDSVSSPAASLYLQTSFQKGISFLSLDGLCVGQQRRRERPLGVSVTRLQQILCDYTWFLQRAPRPQAVLPKQNPCGPPVLFTFSMGKEATVQREIILPPQLPKDFTVPSLSLFFPIPKIASRFGENKKLAHTYTCAHTMHTHAYIHPRVHTHA